jgi:hypothetical protein
LRPRNQLGPEESRRLLETIVGKRSPSPAALEMAISTRPKAAGRTLAPRKMNGAERDYAARLELRKRAGEIADHRFEEITLRIGDDCRYTPDFGVMLPSGTLEFHEVKVEQKRKGKVVVGIEEDARAKLLAAAAHHWWYVFRLAVRKLDGSWSVEEIRP